MKRLMPGALGLAFNTMWYLVMWLAPEKNFCVIAATNIAATNIAGDDARVMMIHKWLPE